MTRDNLQSVTSLETRYVVQCHNDDGDWYDFGIYTTIGEAKLQIGKVRQYRTGAYRLIRRKIQDVAIAEDL